MAVVTNLFHVTSGLGTFLRTRLSTSVVLAPPPDTPLTTEEVRVSLIYVSEHASHRNDGHERNADGSRTPPPLTLSVFYLVTAYGESPNQDADGAHRLLGEVAKALHDEPALDLAALGVLGEGRLQVALVPMTPELMEKLFSPLQIKHRPFLLYEVWPVQLRSALPISGLGAVVSPGGLRLTGPTPSSPPVITRIVPSRPAVDGFIRIDGPFGGAVETVTVGSASFTASSGAVVPVDPAQPERGIRLQLPAAAVRPGIHPVTVSTGTLGSRPFEIQVQASGAWVVDGPATFSHGQSSGPLTLTGQGLASADEVAVWPDRGIFAPSDVVWFAAQSATASSLEVEPTGLSPGLYRLAVRLQPGVGQPIQFTPFIVLELEP